MLTYTIVQAQTFTETIKKEFTFEKKSDANALMLFNISGDVKINGYDGDKIIIEVERKITGKTAERLEQGKREIELGFIDKADTLILYTKGICTAFGKVNHPNGKLNSKKYNGYGYDWNSCNNKKSEETYDYEMNFIIKVPKNIHVMASTVNNGDVWIDNTTKSVVANNVNGSISLNNIKGSTQVSTINGNVDLNYVSNPPADSRYYTLNGDINANFKKGLKADLTFESYNGELYTNVEQLEVIPVSIEKKESTKGLKFKVGGTRYRIGTGGVSLDFETFNGDVYIREM
jgi:DUF4097 and DUF4098 domain-containing protein YvlB